MASSGRSPPSRTRCSISRMVSVVMIWIRAGSCALTGRVLQAASAACITVFSGTSKAAAARRQSSNSGEAFHSSPCQEPVLIWITPNSVSTGVVSRARMTRFSSRTRMPKVVVSRKINCCKWSASAALQSTVSSVPRRPFFMVTGALITSSAPRSNANCAVCARTWGLRSSTAHSNTVTLSAVKGDACAISPMLTRNTLGNRSGLRVPGPVADRLGSHHRGGFEPAVQRS